MAKEERRDRHRDLRRLPSQNDAVNRQKNENANESIESTIQCRRWLWTDKPTNASVIGGGDVDDVTEDERDVAVSTMS